MSKYISKYINVDKFKEDLSNIRAEYDFFDDEERPRYEVYSKALMILNNYIDNRNWFEVNKEKDFDCPVDDCEECEFHRTESWCSKALPHNRDQIDDIYKIRMEGFWEGLKAAEKQYEACIESLEEIDDNFINGTYVEVVRCKECNNYFYDELNDAWFCRIHEYGEEFKPDDYCSYGERRE